MAIRNIPTNPTEELAFYKSAYHLQRALAERAAMTNELNELDKKIGELLSALKPYKTWDEIGEMFNMSGFQAKRYFEPLMNGASS